jgi:hypothetical protein
VNDDSYVHFRLLLHSRHSRRSTSLSTNTRHCGSRTRQWLFLMIYRTGVNLPGSAIVVAAPTLWRDCGKDSAQHLLKPFTIPYATPRSDFNVVHEPHVRIHVPDLTCMLQPPASSQQHITRHVPHRRSAQQPEPGASAEVKGECRAGKPRAAFQSDWVIAPRYYCHHLQHTDSLTHQHARRLLDPPLETSPSHPSARSPNTASLQRQTPCSLDPRPTTAKLPA